MASRFLMKLSLSVAVVATLAACATRPPGAAEHPQDPLEGMNRSISAFNEAVDAAILEPAARGWRAVVPSPVRTGVGNFFDNVGDLWSGINHLLQGEGERAYNHLVRFTTNTVLGLGGFLDIATEAGIPRERQDFGQTLARWGVPSGPYLVLPILGPSTLRDTAALPADFNGYALSHLHPVSDRNVLAGLRIVDTRERLLGATDALDAAALDKYSLLREFYLRQRDPGRYQSSQDDENAGKIESYEDD